MNFESIRDNVIKPKLIDMLGRTLAHDLYSKARFATTQAKNEREKLDIFVSTTCADPNFVGMWGTAQAAMQKKEWLGLFS